VPSWLFYIFLIQHLFSKIELSRGALTAKLRVKLFTAAKEKNRAIPQSYEVAIALPWQLRHIKTDAITQCLLACLLTYLIFSRVG